MTVVLVPPWRYDITLDPEPSSVATARRFGREQLARHDLLMLLDDITFVASELATNAVTHAATPFTVTLTAFTDAVVVTVRDGSASPPVRLGARPDDVAGRGIAIVDTVSSDWGVDVNGSIGKSVWAAFDVGVVPVPRPPPWTGEAERRRPV